MLSDLYSFYTYFHPISVIYFYVKFIAMKKFFMTTLLWMGSLSLFAQKDLPADYLTKEFHAGRRDALRALMAPNSVAVIFAYPTRTFSKDVSYVFHQNPDLYYLSGYNEPNSLLLVFKETQTGADGKKYTELFFSQHRDPVREQWTGRRLGVEGVKTQLGIEQAFDGDAFNSFPLELNTFSTVYFDDLPTDISDDIRDTADLFDLIKVFKRKLHLPDNYDAAISNSIHSIKNLPAKNLGASVANFKRLIASSDTYKNNAVIDRFVTIKDSAELKAFQDNLTDIKIGSELNPLLASLREIKTPEELTLLRKSIYISAIAHKEIMKAVSPASSETEIQGLQEYIHKKYGAEYVGYPSIVGAAENGCILHYEENNRTRIGNNLLLMDVGAEYHGYSADVTRTIPANGKFTAEQKLIYEIVYQAQEEIFKLIKDGTAYPDLNNKAKEILAAGLIKLGIIQSKDELRAYYPHGCSHHLGLDVHDKSNYGSLKENMVITVEPGIYIPEYSACDKKWWGIGVRIEDDILVTKNGYEILSIDAPRSTGAIEKTATEKSIFKNFTVPAIPVK